MGQGSDEALEDWIDWGPVFAEVEEGVGGPMSPASAAEEEGSRWGCTAGEAVADPSGGLLWTGEGFVAGGTAC